MEAGFRGLAFRTKAKIYLPAHYSNAEVASTAVHEGVHMLGIQGSRRAEAMARFAEIRHRGEVIDFVAARRVLRDIRYVTDVSGDRVYMDLPWRLNKQSPNFPGIIF